jgi:hypothetical protein
MFRKHIVKDDKYNDYINKLKWHAFINKRRLRKLSRPSRDRHEDNLLNQLTAVYGKDTKMVIGDWGNKCRLSYISTPNVGIKRLLKKRFDVYHIDECCTSKLHYKTHEKCDRCDLLA